ncbi:sulfite exporter TauE/SafE family protein [Agromyces sp. S2-1-8]|uniref:sulfite exporter TauE/SafE family protein n=1 Tax=Agromyces sp. S2-1-8 TaxID=2897180 RepID=UPI001E3595BE|nr:sulfite exporter TauE/SafE family protein [Agromyces sp. S2-1-8]MCD5345584.1 sulfite exporter TauE/SafE family protein [Agromyces sp. S2-1-8]
MNPVEFLVLTGGGVVAGMINSVVGSGSLVTFPMLLAFGYPPVLANVTNNVGVLPASLTATIVGRSAFAGEWRRLTLYLCFSAAGGVTGALLLLQLPTEAFDMIVPVLIVVALLLVVFGPVIRRWTARLHGQAEHRDHPAATMAVAGLTAVYGGYFGAAQGVLLIALLSITMAGSLVRANAYKNAMASTANLAAAIVFVLVTEVAWPAAIAIAIGAFVGGWLGGRYGRHIPQTAYRVVIVVIGVAALVWFLVR